MGNSIRKVIASTDSKAQYDAQCKKLLSKRVFLAKILKHVVEEFQDLEETEILKSIDHISVSETPTDPGMSIVGRNTEDAELGEGLICYDILFDAAIRNRKKLIQLIINLEAQKSMDTGYSLVTRSVYYAARMISSQKETVFQKDQYQKLRKVYSIWICINPRKYNAGSITEFHLTQKDLVSTARYKKEAYDKIGIIFLNLGQSDDQLLGMLSVLLSNELKPNEKIRRLQNEYKVPMDEEAVKEVSLMCNLSDLIEEKGIRRGIEQGVEAEKRTTVKNMLEHDFTDGQILLVTGITEERLREIKRELGIVRN